MRREGHAVGIDVGGTTVELALVDATGRVTEREEFETRRFADANGLLDHVGQRAAALAGTSRLKTIGVGVSVPGPVHANGVLEFAPNLPGVWKRVDVRSKVARASGLPTFPLNDANAAAFGEFHFGAGQRANSIVLFTLGTGIGGGIVLDGQLLIGARGQAAEIGHTTVDVNGPRCGCGNHGCLEAMTAIPALVSRTLAKLQRGRKSALAELVKGDLAKINREQIGFLLSKAARGNPPDAVALEVIEETAFYLAAAIASLVMVLDPDRVILSGGIAKIGEPLFAPIRRGVAARTAEIPFNVKHIVPARLANAGLVGAAAWAMENAASGNANRKK